MFDHRQELTRTFCASRKFGKQIQKRQLEVPEYAASFVNYKALKKASRSDLQLHRKSNKLATLSGPV